MKALTLIILTFSIIAATFLHPTQTLVTQLQMNLSSTLNHTQQQINETSLISGGTCVYNIYVKTSCNSSTLTTDAIDILIGDANGDKILTKLDGADTGLFKRCTMNPFIVLGHCIGKICKMYLTRVGSDGWMPETITTYHNNYPPVTFNFNYFIPYGDRSGFDYCKELID